MRYDDLVRCNQLGQKMISRTNVFGHKTEAQERIEIRERLGLTTERGRLLKYIWGVKRRHRNENVFARSNGLRENAETAISCRGPGPVRKKK